MSSQDSESNQPVWSPDQILVATFGAAIQQKLELPQAFEFAGSENLARAATAETVNRVLGFYAGLVEQNQPVVFVLAALLERHASKLDDVGRSDLAVPIYEQIAEVYEPTCHRSI